MGKSCVWLCRAHMLSVVSSCFGFFLHESYYSFCRGLFFQSTMDQIQYLSGPPGVQSPTTLVIHGRRNMRKNGPKAIHRAQSPKEERKAQPTWSSNSSPPRKGILKQFENERENAIQASFSLLPWHGARGAEGRHFQGRITFPKCNHYTKNQSSSLTIRHGKCPEEDDPPQHQPKPQKSGRELVLHTTQWSTASCPAVHSKLSHQKNDLRRHQLRPMTKRVTKEMRQG
jgi:hypothetical protein